MKICIAITGENGAGKGSVVRFMHEDLDGRMQGVKVLKFSGLLSETLALWGLPPTRRNLQFMAQAMEEKFGEGTLARAIEQRILAEPAEVVIVDGVRWWSDFELVRRLPKSVLVYVTAPADRRFARLTSRTEKSDEVGMTRELFDANEIAPNEVSIPEIGARADYRIDNTCAWGELHNHAENVVLDVLRKFT